MGRSVVRESNKNKKVRPRKGGAYEERVGRGGKNLDVETGGAYEEGAC